MAQSWREIVVDGAAYRWRGESFVVVQDALGRRVAGEWMHKIKGVSPDVWERGHWKRTSDGQMHPSELAAFIRSAIQHAP